MSTLQFMPQLQHADHEMDSLSPCISPRQWLAAYTVARHEKRIAQHLALRNIEYFLPLYRSAHKWNNGCRKLVELPLFPSYIFVNLEAEHRLGALQVPGICHFVSFQGRPAILPPLEIEKLREALAGGLHAEPYPYLSTGSWVEIGAGPLQGLRGIVLRRKGVTRVVISVDLIQRSVSVELSPEDLVPCPAKRADKNPCQRGLSPVRETAIVPRS